MTCNACTEAEKDPLTPFHESCLDCAARALAQTEAYAESAKAGKLTPGYRNALEQVFIDDLPKWHERVKDWSRRIREAKEVQRMQTDFQALKTDANGVQRALCNIPRTKGKRKEKEG